MKRWTLAAAAVALFVAALWHLPATAQRTTPADNPASAVAPAASVKPAAAPSTAPVRPAPPELITFDEYRDFRLHDIAQRQARLARELAAPDLSASQKADLERRKAYYDGLAAMPADQRNQLFRARFDQIDTNHDGVLDSSSARHGATSSARLPRAGRRPLRRRPRPALKVTVTRNRAWRQCFQARPAQSRGGIGEPLGAVPGHSRRRGG